MEAPPEVCPWERLHPRPAVARGFTALHFGAARAHDSHTCLRVFPLPALSRGVFRVTKRSGAWSTHSQETAGGPERTSTDSQPSADSRPLACSASHGPGSRHCQLGPVRVHLIRALKQPAWEGGCGTYAVLGRHSCSHTVPRLSPPKCKHMSRAGCEGSTRSRTQDAWKGRLGGGSLQAAMSLSSCLRLL